MQARHRQDDPDVAGCCDHPCDHACRQHVVRRGCLTPFFWGVVFFFWGGGGGPCIPCSASGCTPHSTVLHTAPRPASPAACPTGIDQPDLRAVLLQLLAQHGGILHLRWARPWTWAQSGGCCARRTRQRPEWRAARSAGKPATSNKGRAAPSRQEQFLPPAWHQSQGSGGATPCPAGPPHRVEHQGCGGVAGGEGGLGLGDAQLCARHLGGEAAAARGGKGRGCVTLLHKCRGRWSSRCRGRLCTAVLPN